VHSITDLFDDPDVDPKVTAGLRGAGLDFRSTLAVPMKRDDAVVGVLVIARGQTGPFPQRQVDLLQTFADQAVIAIENVRLFDEVQARTRDLSEALQQQTATADVLKVISRSMLDLDSVLQTLIDTAVRLARGSRGTIFLQKGDALVASAFHSNVPEALREYLANASWRLDGDTPPARAAREGHVVHIADLSKLDDENTREVRKRAPYGAGLWVPLIGERQTIGVFGVPRDEPIAFTDREIEIVQTFADQAVIAIENARLFREVQARTQELAASLDDLRKAQDRLIQSEKLASLGQLTAGIAHEIKNPLNFVNNFSALSRELVGELADVIKAAPLDDARREQAEELIGTIEGNLDKVVQHGKRADSIVKNMLLHSREGSGERSTTNVNAMVEEALNLAYHGARAEKPGFNVTIAKSLDPNAGAADLYPQEMTRVLLNLISNGFYATNKRKLAEPNGAYEPTLTASTRDLGQSVEIAIRDNGTGIADEVKAKMFNPFFTTKPAGEGTGLGLSLSHDIVVKQHGGTMEVESAVGAFTQFTIILPRAGEGL
jgi:signal transduction histidine kinase